MENPYSHFYLYAKGWYKETNQTDDLLKILSNYNGQPLKYCTVHDLQVVLSQPVYNELTKNWSRYTFLEFCSNMAKDNNIITTYLRVLCLAAVYDTLDLPDSNILPLKKEN